MAAMSSPITASSIFHFFFTDCAAPRIEIRKRCRGRSAFLS
jgi:hypothetical protein